jgi:phosphoglycerate dehydrogenase-like enzyme
MPHDRHVTGDEMSQIDAAVVSADIWTDGHVASFMKVVIQSPRLQWLQMFSAGLDNPVFAMLRDKGVLVTHAAGSSGVPIAHTVMMHIVAMCRGSRELHVAQGEHRWDARDVDDVEGRTVGIVGLGGIGAHVARLATAFGMRPIGLRRTPTGDEPCETWPTSRLHDLLPIVDDLVLTAPLTDETRGLIGAAELAALRPGAHLVNVARGELIDESALVDALRSGRLGAAALDVFSTEPLPADSPLWDMPTVTVTPHSAGATPLAADRAAAIFLDNLGRWHRGETLVNIGP